MACAEEKSRRQEKITEALYEFAGTQKYFFNNRLISFALIASVIFYWAGFSTTKPAPEPQSVSQPQKTEAANKGLAKAPVSQSSTLEQRQQGKPVGTAPSSPLKDVYFDFDRYDLRADARDILKTNAAWLKQNPASSVEIEGHCDDRATSEYNLALGAKRAQMAKEYLVIWESRTSAFRRLATAKSCRSVARPMKSAGKKTVTIASSSRRVRRANYVGSPSRQRNQRATADKSKMQ